MRETPKSVPTLPWFLRGNFAPVIDERTDVDLDVVGSIPPSLSGTYLRNGSNPKSGTAGHWFFGDGMVHGLRLHGGKAEWYRNRFVQTEKLTAGIADLDPEAMTNPRASAANTHVLAHAGRIWCLEEGHLPYEIDGELNTLGAEDFDGRLRTAFTAHPKLCPETGELHFFGYGVVPPFLTYHVLDAGGSLVHSAPITIPQSVMMHDFMITRDHAIFMDLPVAFDLDKAMTGQPPIGWDDDAGARIGVMPRFGTDADVVWFDVDPCYVFHPLNAFVDDDGSVVCDVGRHESMWRTSMEDGTPCYLHRWRFDLGAGSVQESQLDDQPHAFPRVDERRVGLEHRYGWAVGAKAGGSPDGLAGGGDIVRYDARTGAADRYDLGPAISAGEFVFVPDSDGAAEDDGWALGFAYDATTDTSSLMILDASAPGSDPVATVRLPVRVPFGFHGSWVDDASMA